MSVWLRSAHAWHSGAIDLLLLALRTCKVKCIQTLVARACHARLLHSWSIPQTAALIFLVFALAASGCQKSGIETASAVEPSSGTPRPGDSEVIVTIFPSSNTHSGIYIAEVTQPVDDFELHIATIEEQVYYAIAASTIKVDFRFEHNGISDVAKLTLHPLCDDPEGCGAYRLSGIPALLSATEIAAGAFHVGFFDHHFVIPAADCKSISRPIRRQYITVPVDSTTFLPETTEAANSEAQVNQRMDPLKYQPKGTEPACSVRHSVRSGRTEICFYDFAFLTDVAKPIQSSTLSAQLQIKGGSHAGEYELAIIPSPRADESAELASRFILGEIPYGVELTDIKVHGGRVVGTFPSGTFELKPDEIYFQSGDAPP